MTRDKLVSVALMTGSDYTEGVETMENINALEVQRWLSFLERISNILMKHLFR